MTRVSFSFATPSRRGFRSLLIAIAMVASLLPFAVATALPALGLGRVVAFDMVGSSSQNLTSFTDDPVIPFTSPGDGFQKYQVGVSATIPFAVFDESLGGFPTDSQGIIDESNTDEFFGVTDTVNSDNSAPVSATWVFDIGGATDLGLSIDMGAMGDFESSDTFTWTYQVDGGPIETAFVNSVDEAGSLTYTLAGGSSFTLSDPMLVDGVVLSNVLQTFTAPINGTGSELALTLTASTNGGSEAFAFQNIIVVADFEEPLTVSCPSELTVFEGDAGTVTVAATDPDDQASWTLTSVAPIPSAGSITLLQAPLPGIDGQTATADITAETDVTAGVYEVLATASNLAGESVECAITVSVLGLTPIPAIQGASHTSPLLGSLVATAGIVTAVDSNALYLQDATGDGSIATSDAIVVFTGNRAAAVGDSVRVIGTVSEFFPGGAGTGNLSTTQLSSLVVEVLSSGNPVPAPVILGASGRVPPNVVIDDDPLNSFDPADDGIDFYESVEAMLVTVEDAVAVAGTTRFGEISAVANSGADATGLTSRGTINISPSDFNPERIQIDEDSGIFNFAFPTVDTGDPLGDITGVVGYSFGNFEVYPTVDFTGGIGNANLTPETSDIAPRIDQLTVASYNVLNLDPNDGDGDTDVANGRFAAVATQIVDALNSPDIVGLQEVQDNTGSDDDGVTAADETLQLLVDEVAAAGGPVYAFIDNTFIGDKTSGGQPGANIRTAFLYNPDRVDLVQGSVTPVVDAANQQVDPTNPFWDARLPIAATFVFNGQDVTVVNNHFSSKGGSSPLFGTIQPSVDLQEDPSVNGSLDERQAQATAIAGFTDAILDSDPNANVVVVGDFNEFEFISPLDVILGENLSNLTLTLPEDERYTFIFDGNSQALDHILVSDALEAGAVFDEVHVNVEFAATSTRASDHDPVLVGLDFSARTIKWTQVVELEALLGVGSRADDKLLKRAIRDLERSLADGLWTSNTTLSPIYGDLVFTRERQAASRLLQLSEALSESVYPVFESLLIADRQLAVIAIGIAGDTGGDLTAAERFLGLGDDDWAAGAYEMAITRYKQAWEEAVAATLP